MSVTEMLIFDYFTGMFWLTEIQEGRVREAARDEIKYNLKQACERQEPIECV